MQEKLEKVLPIHLTMVFIPTYLIYGFITCLSHVFTRFFLYLFIYLKGMQSVFLYQIKQLFQDLFVYLDLNQKLLKQNKENFVKKIHRCRICENI